MLAECVIPDLRAPVFDQSVDIATFGIRQNDYSLFLEKRAERIENQFRLLLGLKSKTEQQFEEEPSGPIDLVELKLRDLIHGKLEAAYGPQFWSDTVPSDIRVAVEMIDSHIKSHPYDSDKLSSGVHRLSFLDIMDYSKVILSNWTVFSGVFQSKSELEKHFLGLKSYRNSVKHRRELNAVEKELAKQRFCGFTECSRRSKRVHDPASGQPSSGVTWAR